MMKKAFLKEAFSMKKRLISLLLAVGMMLSLFPVSAFAESPAGTPKQFKVSTANGFKEAVEDINRQSGGNYTISLLDDIELADSEDLTLTQGETTILGNGHTLSGGKTQTLGVSGSGTVLNLGQETGSDKLTLDGKNASSITAVCVSNSAKLNMYKGVTIQNYTNSGIQNTDYTSSTGSVFHMYGGCIQNCSGSAGGGVYVIDGTFTMEDGEISNCKASSLGGGGVAITAFSYGSNLNLNGGRIINNSAENGFGGGILIYNKCTVNSVQNMIITGNTAQQGGGICLVSLSSRLANISVDMSSSTNALCNNIAGVYGNEDAYGDDVFLSGAGDRIRLPAATEMNQNYGTTGHKIDGWYTEQADSHYTPNEDGVPTNVSRELSGLLALVASYKLVRSKITLPDPNSYAAAAKNTEGAEIRNALCGEEVRLSFDTAKLPEDKLFDQWKVTDANGCEVTVKQDDNGYYFEMPECDVTVSLVLKPAKTNPPAPDPDEPDKPDEPDEPDSPDAPDTADPASSIVGGVLLGAAAGAVGYYAGTGMYLEDLFGYVPANRQALASALWEKADKPEPQNTALYTDVDEQDLDAQKADRWCVEQGLISDRGDDTFRPAGWVTHTQCLISWFKLEKMLEQ